MQGKAAGPFLHNIIGVIMRVEALKNRAVAPDPGVYLGDEEDIWNFFIRSVWISSFRINNAGSPVFGPTSDIRPTRYLI